MKQNLMQKAFTDYYNNIVKFNTISEAQVKAKSGEWIFKVNPITGDEPFFTLHTFKDNQDKWMYTGAEIGMWNEITVIGKTK